MITTVTTVTAITAIGLTAVISIVAVVSLIVFLITKELASASVAHSHLRINRRFRIARFVDVGTIPLLMAFVIIVAVKIVELW